MRGGSEQAIQPHDDSNRPPTAPTEACNRHGKSRKEEIMQTRNGKLIRGFNIATVVMASFAIIGCLIGFAALGLGGFTLNEYGDEAISLSYAYDDAHGHDRWDNLDPDFDATTILREHSLDEGQVMGLANAGLAIAGVAIAWELIMCIVALIAGIVGISGASKKQKMGRVFVWSIVGAVASLLSGRFISTGLFIASAIFANKNKNAPDFIAQTGAAAPGAPMPGAYAQAGAAVPGAYAPSAAAPSAAQPYAAGQQPIQQTAYNQTYSAAAQAAPTQSVAAQPAATSAQPTAAAQPVSASAQPANTTQPTNASNDEQSSTPSATQ